MSTKLHMTPYELAQTDEFDCLTPKQAVWLLAYVQNFTDTGVFDPTVATAAAYDCKNSESERTFGYHMLANPKIKKALQRFDQQFEEIAIGDITVRIPQEVASCA